MPALHSRAAFFPSPKTPLMVAARDVPEPGPGEVRLQLEVCGLGFADWNTAMLDVLPRLPLVPGQEAVGVVESVGPGVTLAVGARVGVTPLAFACRACSPCERGLERHCAQARLTGLHVDGALAEHGVFRAESLVALPAGLDPLTTAPLLGSGWTALGALRAAGVGRGVAVGLYGVGGVGHLAVALAVHLKAEVRAVDPDPARRALAAELGATVSELLAPASLDAAVMCTPSAQAVTAALRALKPTGTLVLAGLTPAGRLDLPIAEVVAKGFRVQGSFLGSRSDLAELLELAHTGQVRSRVDAHPLSEAPDLLWLLRDGGFTGRLVVDLRR